MPLDLVKIKCDPEQWVTHFNGGLFFLQSCLQFFQVQGWSFEVCEWELPVLFDFEVSDPDVGGEVGLLRELGPTSFAVMDLPFIQGGRVSDKVLFQPLLGVERVAAGAAVESFRCLLMNLREIKNAFLVQCRTQ